MPYKDSKKHRDYYRDYMRRRRAGQPAKPKPSAADAAKVATLEARVRELEAELARERQRAKMLEAGLQAARQAQPKAAKPPLPPDEARERTIKGLRTRVRNLEAAWAALTTRANMPRAVQNAIVKALHPDRKLSAAEREAERETALKLFTSWKADKDKPQRQAR